MIDPANLAREDVANDVLALRIRTAVDGLLDAEDQLSVMDWIDRIKQASVQAFSMARAGSIMEEYTAWTEIASFACARAEQIRRQQLIDDSS